MEVIDLKSREWFGQQGRGVAVLVEEENLKIRQVGLEPGKEVPVHVAEAPLTMQVVSGEGVFSVADESLRMGSGKLLRIPQGVTIGVRNEASNPLVFLVIQGAPADRGNRESALAGRPGSFVNLIDFAPLKPGKEESFQVWFHNSSQVFARHRGFISRTLLAPIEGGSRYAAIVEHESKETFMDMHLSDDREELFLQVEPLVLGSSTPHFYETLLSYRK